ncbi:unnamed protein product [Withania somnifera]
MFRRVSFEVFKPPLKEVPEGDWICVYCEAKKEGKVVEMPGPPKGKKGVRTAKEKLLDSDLWAARIESIWKEVDGTSWFKAYWYIIPEETDAGRQMEAVIRHCYVMYPKEFEKARNEGDDVFLCEYEYDIHWHSFKRIYAIEDNDVDDDEAENDGDWNSCKDPDSDMEDDVEYERENQSSSLTRPSPAHPLAANSRKGRFFGLQKIGVKKIPEHLRSHKLTELEKAKATLLLATLLNSLPCRLSAECSKEENRPCLLHIDELDLLVTRNQAPTKPHSELIVIGIANTMDLAEKLLPRISSRMGIQRLCFGPYNYQQLQEIFLTRLNGIEVAAVSGDARRALEICWRAVELADYRVKKFLSIPDSAAAGKMLVRMADVEAAIQEMFQAPHIQKMKDLFLAAMVYEGHKTGMSETTFDKLAITVSCLCTSNSENFPGWDVLLKVGDGVSFALKDSKDLPWLAKYL